MYIIAHISLMLLKVSGHIQNRHSLNATGERRSHETFEWCVSVFVAKADERDLRHSKRL